MKKQDMFETLGDLPDDMVLNAEVRSVTALAGSSASAKAARRERRRNKWRLITTDNRFVAAASLLVAFGVLFGIVQAGRMGTGQTIDKHTAAGRQCTVRLQPTNEDLAAEAEALPQSAAERLGLESYHGMGLNDTCTLTFTANGDGTCTLTDIDVNVLYEKPFTLIIPDTSPDGDTVTAVMTDSLCQMPLFLSDADFIRMTDTVAAGLTNGKENLYYKILMAYYGGEHGQKSVSRMNAEYLTELLAIIPITKAVDLWVFDSSASLYEHTGLLELMYQTAPTIDAATRYAYLLNLQAIADAAGGLAMPMELTDFRADGRYIRAVELPREVERIMVGTFGTCFRLTELRTDMTVAQMQTVEWINTRPRQYEDLNDGLDRTVMKLDGVSYLPTTAFLNGRGYMRFTRATDGVPLVCADGTILLRNIPNPTEPE